MPKRFIMAGGLFLALFGAGCFSDTEKTQYIAVQNGKELQPYAKVLYRISVDRQEVAYWIETPGQGRSKVYRLKKCTVTDPNNWQGEADYILLWKIKVEMVHGKFNPLGEGLADVSWFTWHFRTDPNPGPLSAVLRYGLLLFLIFVMIAAALIFLRVRAMPDPC